jgi:hypothetical protein
MTVAAELLRNGKGVQSAAVDNAVATASVPAASSVRHAVMGIDADYSAAPAAGFKTITLKFAAVTKFIWRWDFTKGPFARNLPAPWHGEHGEAVSVELEASGTPAVTGRAGLWYASR